jgi:hypothetical protein
MRTFGEELRQPRRGLRRSIRPGDPREIEAALARDLRQRRLERRRVVQKSRLA